MTLVTKMASKKKIVKYKWQQRKFNGCDGRSVIKKFNNNNSGETIY